MSTMGAVLVRLTILTQYYPPELGAPQNRLSELASRFVERGHVVTVLTAMPNYPKGRIFPGYGGILAREVRDGVNVIRTMIYPTQKADFLRRMTNYMSFVASSAVAGSFALERPDYLLVESPPLFLGFSGIWLSWLKRTRLIFNVSDLWPESAVRLGAVRPGSLSHRLSAWLESTCYKHSWLVTGQSQGILQDIGERFPNCSLYHLSNGVDTSRFQIEPLSAIGTSSVGLYAGLHGLAQGLDQILAAADSLRAETNQRFILVGDGPEKSRLRAEAERMKLTNVEFRDPRPASEVPQILAQADFLMVSLRGYIPGAVPSKLYEAMAAGRPVILIANGEAADIVRRHEVGIVVEPGDVNGIVRAVRQLSSNPGLRQRLGLNGRRAALEYFDRTKIAARFIDYLENSL
jgi:glycosyltransferase involved in cell wall biosynthesis